jgi:hypothetical protein
VEVTKERSFEQLAVNTIGQLPAAASGVERVGRAIERRALLSDEVFPRLFVAGRASTGQGEVFEMQRVELCTAFGTSLERFSKPLERHPPALGACLPVKALDERGVNRQRSHSTPGALIGDDAQQHADDEWKQRAADLTSERRKERRAGHDDHQTRCCQRRQPRVDPQCPGKNQPDGAAHFGDTNKSEKRPGSATGPCCIASIGRTSFTPPANANNAASSP